MDVATSEKESKWWMVYFASGKPCRSFSTMKQAQDFYLGVGGEEAEMIIGPIDGWTPEEILQREG